jgi:hypothetical protein
LELFLVPIFGILLGDFLTQFWGYFLGQNDVQKLTFFLQGSCGRLKGILGGFLAVLGLSWEGGDSQSTAKTIRNDDFQNRSFSLSQLLGMAFGGHSGSFW